MAGFSRLVATGLTAVLLLAQIGCTTTGGTTASTAQLVPRVDAIASTDAKGLPEQSTTAANPSNYVEPGAAGSTTWAEGEIPGYSNTYVYETLDGPGAGPFATAAYFDGGGYPIYYPYPYTIGSRPQSDLWNSGYSSSARPFRSASGAASNIGTAAVNAKAGRGVAGERARARGKPRASGARSQTGRVNRASAASAQRQAASGGHRRSGKTSARTNERQPSAGYLAARGRSGYRSGASHGRLYYRDRKGDARARPSGVTRVHPSSRAASAPRRSGKRR